ncbi:MAG: PASTA domain-containing protein, partial [Eubacterium sp.]|nr:PASTA domain-containing protein [Eubacterium sp.]
IITWNDAVYFISQILKALQHAHDKGIVHRDIKPQNIILLSTGEIKVTDFGIARFSRTETRTLTENAIGSVHYISPEQAKGELTDERADIYSLGVVFYEMLTGTVPFEADSAVSVALMQVRDDAKRLTDINPDIPIGLEQICFHAMQKNPLERYQTATEMLLDLEEVIRNPNATFDYSYVVDKQPTKFVKREEDIKASPSSDDYDDEDELEEKKNRKKIVTATILGLVLLVVAIVGLVFWLTKGVETGTVKLESFVGQAYDTVISNYDYTFIADYEKTDEYEAGQIIRQSPEAGERVISGATITLIVAASADDITVPNIYEITKERAEQELQRNGLTNIKFADVVSETVQEGYVIYSDPKVGSFVSADTLITVFVSTGPSTTTIDNIRMPDVTGLSQSDAVTFLTKLGFTNVVVEPQDSEIQKGIIVDQDPLYRTTISADSQIRIYVSTGVSATESTTDDTTGTSSVTPNNPYYPNINNNTTNSNSQTNRPATNPPATNPPATNPPATNSPATNPPATNPPATNPPTYPTLPDAVPVDPAEDDTPNQ